MSKYLKDGKLEYLTITEIELKSIYDKLCEIRNEENEKIDKTLTTLEKGGRIYKLSYILRADGTGVTYTNYAEFIAKFNDATEVERVIMTLRNSFNEQQRIDKQIDLRFDPLSDSLSSYLVEDDCNTWVEGVLNTVIKPLSKFKNYNHIFYSSWFAFVFQITGVFLILLLSVWLSSIIAPYLTIESPFLVAFVVIIMLFSNLWVFLSSGAKEYIDKEFPKIQFKKREKWDWIWKGATLLLIGYVFQFLISKLSKF